MVVNKNYASDGPDALTLRRGDLVEVLDTGTSSTADSKYVFNLNQIFVIGKFLHIRLSEKMRNIA